jgi:hypothetical protein
MLLWQGRDWTQVLIWKCHWKLADSDTLRFGTEINVISITLLPSSLIYNTSKQYTQPSYVCGRPTLFVLFIWDLS